MKKLTNEQFINLIPAYLADPASDFLSLGEWFYRRRFRKYPVISEIYEEKRLVEVGALIAKHYLEK